MNFAKKIKRYKSYLINLIVPAVVFGFITGTLTALVVTLYKLTRYHNVSLNTTKLLFYYVT